MEPSNPHNHHNDEPADMSMHAGSLPAYHPGGQRVLPMMWSEALQAAKASNPAVKSLAVGLENLQTNLRSEAQQRLGGFVPPLQLTMAADDWDLLKRVGSKTSASTPQGMQHGMSGTGMKPFLPAFSNSMKRSASENSLESMNNNAGQPARKHSKQGSGWGWEQAIGDNNWPPTLLTSDPQLAQAHASAMQAMTRKPIGLITSAAEAERRQRQEQDEGSSEDSDSYFNSSVLRARRSHPPSSTWGGSTEESTALTRVGTTRRGMPRVGTAPTLQDITETLNSRASRNLEAVRAALQSAQASIQETANNCSQNLQTLTTIFQQNLNSNGGPLQAALSNSRAMVTWTISNGSDPFGGALVPWQVFPRTLRARELDAAQAAARNSVSLSDWITPLEQYMAKVQGGHTHKKQSLRDPGRQVAIVTTASLPWLTGTAVNPLLRAAYLSDDASRKVTLVLPWLSPADQARVFPHNMHFDTPEQQEEYVRNWARQRTGLDCNFKVTFYPSRYAAEKGSILPVGDITQCIPDHEADVAVLEEPEHLNWYHHGTRWTDKFNHVVGVMHTNYLDYARREENGNVKEMLLKHINAWVCRIHCHKVIKLSDAVQHLPRQDTMFVHGVSPAFLRVGQAKAAAAARISETGEPSEDEKPLFGRGAYFLGKVLWAKGYTELLDRLNEHAQRTGQPVAVDVYGSGPDLKAVEEEAVKRKLPLKFNGARDHADETLQDYKVFINPSLSDVVATTTAEALAMGKWVVCADHPSNRFFQRFDNCLIYRDSQEFSKCLDKALKEDPKPLSPQDLHSLTWEAATERFLDVADDKVTSSVAAPLEASLDNVLHALHNTLTGVEALRMACGAGARTRDMPARITDYEPDENETGGFFDNAARAKKSWDGKKAVSPSKKQQPVEQATKTTMQSTAVGSALQETSMQTSTSSTAAAKV